MKRFIRITLLKFRKNANKIYVFIACILFSIVIWLSINQSDTYTRIIKCPFKLINLPADKILLNDQDTFLTLKVSNKRSGIFNFFYSENAQIFIDLNEITLIKTGKSYEGRFNKSEIIDFVSKQLDPDYKIESVFPSVLNFNFVDEVHKKVPIKVDLLFDLEKQYQLSGPVKCNLDCVEITGIKENVETIKYIKTEPKILSKLSQSQNFKISLINPFKNHKLFLSSKEINITIPVDKFTEGKIRVPIEVINCDKNFTLKIFPDEVFVTYFVTLRNYNKVKPEMFRAIVNCTEINDSRMIKVTLSQKPEFVNNIKIKPEKVEYIQIKK